MSTLASKNSAGIAMQPGSQSWYRGGTDHAGWRNRQVVATFKDDGYQIDVVNVRDINRCSSGGSLTRTHLPPTGSPWIAIALTPSSIVPAPRVVTTAVKLIAITAQKISGGS
jgi:hypothetical protein